MGRRRSLVGGLEGAGDLVGVWMGGMGWGVEYVG